MYDNKNKTKNSQDQSVLKKKNSFD